MPDNSSAAVKVCVVCRKDCSNRPRTKDGQGRYTCRKCVDRLQEQQQASAVAEGDLALNDLASLAQAEASVESGLRDASDSLCRKCRAVIGGEKVCPFCGFDRELGRVQKPKSEKAAPSPNELREQQQKRQRMLAMWWYENPLAWALGGVAGSAIGALVLGGVAIWTGFFFATSLALIGLGAGVGVRRLAGGNSGPLSGLIAVVVALVATLAAQFLIATQIAHNRLDTARSRVMADSTAPVRYLASVMIEQAAAPPAPAAAGVATAAAQDSTSEEPFQLSYLRSRREIPPVLYREADKIYNDFSPAERQELDDELSAWVDLVIEQRKANVRGRAYEATLGFGGDQGFGAMLATGSIGLLVGTVLSLIAAYWFGTGGDPLG